MNFLSDVYQKSLIKNEESLRFWENYLQSLRDLDFSVYADKLKVPVLVPAGNRILFRGELKHTNEVTVSLGADYFVKCSVKQAEVLRQHRIKGAESKVEALQKEREYIQNHFSFSKEHVFQDQGQEIFEEYTEEEDLKWREKHRENIREYKQKSKNDEPKEEITDEDLWYRLEELELKEELEEEMNNTENVPDIRTRILTNKDLQNLEPKYADVENDIVKHTEPEKVTNKIVVKETNSSKTKDSDMLIDAKGPKVSKEIVVPKNNSKLDLLQQVIEKQNELKQKLSDLRNKEHAPSQTEKDLFSKLDEMEQLDELEDEMDRLDDILEGQDVEENEDTIEEEQSKSPAAKIKRSVSFADEDDSKTLNISFTHSDAEPDTTLYDRKKGITKPSDIYSAFSDLFSETTSILKKSKYERELAPSGPRGEKRTKVCDFQEAADNRQLNKTISLNDVVEKVDENDNKFGESEKRPISLFKKRRQQNRR